MAQQHFGMAYTFRDSHDLSNTINALRCAADRFDTYARDMQDDPGLSRLAEQFRHQANCAKRIANDLEALEG